MKQIKVNFAPAFAVAVSASELETIGKDIMAQFKAQYVEAKKRFAVVAEKSMVTVNVADNEPKKSAQKSEPKGAKSAQKSEPTTKKTNTKGRKGSVGHAATASNVGAEKALKGEPTKQRTRREYKNQVSVTDTKALKKLGLQWVQYSEKCGIVRSKKDGDTKKIADFMMNDMHVTYKTWANGWVIPQSKTEAVKKALKLA